MRNQGSKSTSSHLFEAGRHRCRAPTHERDRPELVGPELPLTGNLAECSFFGPRRNGAGAQKVTGGGCRPDSVPRGAASIHLGRTLPCGSSSQPGNLTRRNGMRGQVTLDSPIRPCSAWGLPCPLRFRRSGALLPHPFTLTPGRPGGGLLSAALSLALPRPGVTRRASCRGVRTFLRGASPSGRPPPPATKRITFDFISGTVFVPVTVSVPGGNDAGCDKAIHSGFCLSTA